MIRRVSSKLILLRPMEIPSVFFKKQTKKPSLSFVYKKLFGDKSNGKVSGITLTIFVEFGIIKKEFDLRSNEYHRERGYDT